MLVLCSSSPSRHQLMQQLQLEFNSCAPEIVETPLPNESPEDLVRRLAFEKTQACVDKYPNDLLIGSDTVLVVGGKIFGKPHTKERAFKQIKLQQGRKSYFITGLCLFNSATCRQQINTAVITVKMRSLTDERIHHYLENSDALECAGGIKVEDVGISLFESICSDDPSALIGMPLMRLITMLENEGFTVQRNYV